MKRRPPGRSPSSRESAEHFRGLFVERGVDFRSLLGLSLFLRRVLLAVVRSAAEIEPEAREARAVAAIAADLLERCEQRLALVRLRRHLFGGADVDRPVALEAGRGRDQLADDHVLLQPEQAVDLALDRGVGQHLGRLLEGGRREEGLGRERRLRDPENQRLPRCLLLLLLDRKSTRLNSSHPSISYAVFCLKKKK